MIRDVASLDTIKTLISQVSKNIMQNVQSPVSIEVLNKLDLAKYLIKMGDKELVALSQNELALNTKYWAEVKTDEGGLVRLLNLAKKPDLLQSQNAESDNILTQTLDFEKLKQAVDEYVKESYKTVPQNDAKQTPVSRDENPKTTNQKIEESKAKVENELKTAKDDMKEAPKDSAKAQAQSGEVQKDTKEGAVESKRQETQKDGSKTTIDEKRASADTVQQKSEHEKAPLKLVDKDSLILQEKNKAETKEEKPVNDKEAKGGQETEKRVEKEASKEVPKPTQQKDNSDKPIEHKYQDVKESIKEDAKHEKSADAKKEPETKENVKPEIKDTAEKSQKTQNQETQKKDIPQAQKSDTPREQVRENTKESTVQPQTQKAQIKEPDRHDAKDNSQKTDQKHVEQPLPDTFKSVVGGELAKEELQQLLMKKELIDTPDKIQEPIENKELAKTEPEVVKDIQENIRGEKMVVTAGDAEEKENVAKEITEEGARQDEAKSSVDGPSSKIKSEVLNEMTKSDNKEQFQIFSNLALNLNNNGFTMFVKGEDGKDGVLQFRKKAGGGVLTPKSVEFYSAFEHLGPIAGEIWQYNDKTYLSLDVEFESTMKVLSQTLNDLEFFDKKNVTVRKGIVELFQIQNSFLNLLG